MLFSKFGELVRIDMKRNYAFVQFTSVDDATRARNATNGGKLDQNVITVECECKTSIVLLVFENEGLTHG
jgi:RNA-binding proteins (RRM domain)